MILEVPARGEGDVILKSQNSGFELIAKKFFTRKAKGKTTFYVVFDGLKRPGSNGPETTMVLKGAYLRGSNMALYYGDIYKRKGTPSEIINQKGFFEGDFLNKRKGFSYLGGFYFKSEIPQ